MAKKSMATIKWFDTDTCDSVLLAAEAYDVRIKTMEPTGEPNEIWVCVDGAPENVERFVNDVEEGDVEPFESKRDLSDDDYLTWLSEALQRFGVLFIPKYLGEEIDED